MASHPLLNHDVLLAVLDLSQQDDISRFMRTCRFFYNAALPPLLRQTVHLDSDDRLRQFLTFLHVQPHSRCSLLSSLHLDAFYFSESAALDLALALPLMLNLRSLRFDDADYFMSYPPLSTAFAALSSVRHLTMSPIGKYAVGMLLNFQSSLVHAHLDFHAVGFDLSFFDELPHSHLPRYHPAVLLARSIPTLRALTTFQWRMHDHHRPDPSLVYPHMRHLDLDSSHLILTAVFMHAYPNLTHLSYRVQGGEVGPAYNARRAHEFLARHHLNVREQTHNPASTWTRLQEFNGSLLDLYVLGLTCPIDTIRFSSVDEHVPDMLHTALSYARPRSLEFYGWPKDLRCPAPDVCAVFRGEAGSRLESLTFKAGIDRDDRDVDVAAVMEGLLSSLLSSPLRQFKVIVDAHPLVRLPPAVTVAARFSSREDRPQRPPPSFAERCVEAFDVEDYLRRLAAAIPSLRDAVLQVLGPYGRTRKAVLADGEIVFENIRV
ncbi:hypothetical protein OH77DRAFT_1431897 [Trametes cingulata]|nr:hypothetical protein OH77DRAFT_1431897 [Trametes cingulata]